MLSQESQRRFSLYFLGGFIMESNPERNNRFGSILSSIKQETKVFANVAYVRGSELVSGTKTKLVENGYLSSDYYSNGSLLSSLLPGVVSMNRQEFTEDKDNSTTLDTISIPENSDIILYPSYTVKKDSFYYVEIRGWATCPGLMNRKNRIVFSLAKQLIKPGSRNENILNNVVLQTTGHTADIANPDNNHQRSQTTSTFGDDQFSVRSKDSESSANNNVASEIVDDGMQPITDEDVLKQRMSYFFARSLQSVPITIKICPCNIDSNDLTPTKVVSSEVISDLNGKFETLIRVPYKPLDVEVSVTTDKGTFISRFQDVMISSDNEISVITDIDDTIKDTQILADKRTLFNNVFIRDINDSCISGVPALYQFLQRRFDANFHYVSNSPWQLYSTIIRFLNVFSFPTGSIHMKQYTGNIMSSLMEPAAERKKVTLYKLFEEFSNKKFILIGDSGEKDLEAYFDVSRKFPSQVVKIYIRVVATSLSDYDDLVILKKLRKLIELRKQRIEIKKEYMKFSNSIEPKIEKSNYVRKPPTPPEPRKLSSTSFFKQNSPINNSTPDLLDLGQEYTPNFSPQNVKIRPQTTTASREATAAASTAINNYMKKPPLPERSRSKAPNNSVKISTDKTPLPERSNSKVILNSIENAYSNEDNKEIPPIPKKPISIRSNPIKRAGTFNTDSPSPSASSSSSVSNMKLNPEKVLFSRIKEDPDGWTAKESHMEQRLSSLSIDEFSKNNVSVQEPLDRKGEIWIQKVKEMLSTLPDHIDFMLWQDPKEIMNDCK